MRDFTKLDIWKRSHLLTLRVYKITMHFPKEELFKLTSQIRSCAYSVPMNIAEGCGRDTNPQLAHFLQISTGSCNELQYQFILSKDLEYISNEIFNELHTEIVEIRRMIIRYRSML